MKILSQGQSGLNMFMGVVGAKTPMRDSLGEKLFVGDIVGIKSKNGFMFDLYWVKEENTNIANFTGQNKQFVDGIASIWNDKSEVTKKDFYGELEGWVVKKLKDFSNIVNGENLKNITVEELSKEDEDKLNNLLNITK